MTRPAEVSVYLSEALGRYGFPGDHPFGPDRLEVFWQEARRQGLDREVEVRAPAQATPAALERFHTPGHVAEVQARSRIGHGAIGGGDTDAFPGCFEAAATVVGAVLDALTGILAGDHRRAFVPIAGLHHALPESARGFCIFNDCSLAIEALRIEHHLARVAYVDIDAHHGDGVYYPFEHDPELFIADLHEDGRFLYPGTGAAWEIGLGQAEGTKLNFPLPPGSDDEVFLEAWPQLEEFLEDARPEFILFQCGADSIAGDPIAHLSLSPRAHAHAARTLVRLADRHCQGRLLALGGGGYNRQNLAIGWCEVLRELCRGG